MSKIEIKQTNRKNVCKEEGTKINRQIKTMHGTNEESKEESKKQGNKQEQTKHGSNLQECFQPIHHKVRKHKRTKAREFQGGKKVEGDKKANNQNQEGELGTKLHQYIHLRKAESKEANKKNASTYRNNKSSKQ